MLYNIKELYGSKLSAVDGEIGNIKDFFFDDESWKIQYLVADTGSQFPGGPVLIVPRSLGKLDPLEKTLHATFTTRQINDSPSVDTRLPDSRQYGYEYYRYYGLPKYWGGGELSVWSNDPIVLPAVKDEFRIQKMHHQQEDEHFRSTLAVTGYGIQTPDGSIGHVAGFMVEVENWSIRNLIVMTGSESSDKMILISTNSVDHISYMKSTVFADLTMEEIKENVEIHAFEHAI